MTASELQEHFSHATNQHELQLQPQGFMHMNQSKCSASLQAQPRLLADSSPVNSVIHSTQAASTPKLSLSATPELTHKQSRKHPKSAFQSSPYAAPTTSLWV